LPLGLTAATFFLRYGMQSTLMEYHPDELLTLSLLTAIKAEDLSRRVSLVALCRGVVRLPGTAWENQEPSALAQRIRGLEPDFAAKLQFHFLVHLPLRPLRGLLADMHAKELLPQAQATMTPSLEQALWRWWSVPEVQFGASPARVALAIAAEAFGDDLVHRYLDTLPTGSATASTVLADCRRLQALCVTRSSVTTEQGEVRRHGRFAKIAAVLAATGGNGAWPVRACVQGLLQKLARCRNPFLDPFSAE
jgi:hypothetical protein